MGKPLERTAVFTRDLGCVTQNHVPVEGIGLLDGLEAAGFEWVPKGDGTPPAAVFVWPNRDHREVEVEFLTPARGDGRNRVVTIQPDLTAQALRDLDILLDGPGVVELDERSVALPDSPQRRTKTRLTRGKLEPPAIKLLNHKSHKDLCH